MLDAAPALALLLALGSASPIGLASPGLARDEDADVLYGGLEDADLEERAELDRLLADPKAADLGAVEDELALRRRALRTASRARAIALGLDLAVGRRDEGYAAKVFVAGHGTLTILFDLLLEPSAEVLRPPPGAELERRRRCEALARAAEGGLSRRFRGPAVHRRRSPVTAELHLRRDEARSRALGCSRAEP